MLPAYRSRGDFRGGNHDKAGARAGPADLRRLIDVLAREIGDPAKMTP
jgi:hypothetical protein